MPRDATQSALVTGAARGIGLGIARRLVSLGWDVAISDRDAAAGRDAAKSIGARFFACDVSSEASVRTCVRRAAKAMGGIGALVNNAGLTGAIAVPPERLSLAEWNRRIGVNLTG